MDDAQCAEGLQAVGWAGQGEGQELIGRYKQSFQHSTDRVSV